MNESIARLLLRRVSERDLFLHQDKILRQGLLKLLAVKDSDIRALTLEQSRDAVDQGVHAGGAFSATIPLVALFYGGFLKLDIENPARPGQDIFTLSKGHAVATLASIYADLGYLDASILKNSRSHESILNGHPGPLLPGVQVATGPMGQGMGVAQGFAVAGRIEPRFDSYCLTGDGELQEGMIWEAAMYAGQNHLDNLCVLVDRNYGQLDIHTKNVFPMPDLNQVFRSFGWNASDVDSTEYEAVMGALERFRFGERNGKPTAIICHSTKGYGAFSDFLNRHKVTPSAELIARELTLQAQRRQTRVGELIDFFDELDASPGGRSIQNLLLDAAREMHLEFDFTDGERSGARSVHGPVLSRRVPPRNKQIRYNADQLPKLDPKKQYNSTQIVSAAMNVFAQDSRVISIDSDLGTTSGLESGVAAVDQRRALNVGVAEANMMLIGEAFAALGNNAWVSTFCPFFNWQVLRRIAVGQQERLESIQSKTGWLSEGHELDLTFLATAANFETRTNGATHMGNDDSTTFDAVGKLKIIDVSCPQQLLSVMKWIMEGNRSLVYVRVMRADSPVLYAGNYEFCFGKGYLLRSHEKDRAVIMSSGRAVHESLAAAELCSQRGYEVAVVDMPSVDDELLLENSRSNKLLVFAEQNNGYLWQNFLKVLYRNRGRIDAQILKRTLAINTLSAEGKPQFLHSATYDELKAAFALTPHAIAHAVETAIVSVRS